MARESAPAPLPHRSQNGPDWAYVSETMMRNHADLAAWFSPFTFSQRFLEAYTNAVTAQSALLSALLSAGRGKESERE